MFSRVLRSGVAAVALVTALAACGDPQTEEPQSEEPLSRADSIAAAVLEAAGGQEAWQALRYLSFHFAIEQDGARRPVARHLWDRHSGDYRVEWTQNDTTVVALFNVNTREGSVFAGGVRLDSTAAAPLLQRAYSRFINDTYWMLMPVKLLDPGVNRTFVADSSSAETDVIRLTFGEVGLTPGDTYWVYVDRDTGLVERWAFVLQGNPDAPPAFFRWTEWTAFDGPEGPVWISTRKERENRAILTDSVRTPASVPTERFLAP